MEKYQLLDIIEVNNKDFNGYCVQILVSNTQNPMQKEIVNSYITKEEKEYISQYGADTPITSLFKVKYDFYKRAFRLKFNSELLK